MHGTALRLLNTLLPVIDVAPTAALPGLLPCRAQPTPVSTQVLEHTVDRVDRGHLSSPAHSPSTQVLEYTAVCSAVQNLCHLPLTLARMHLHRKCTVLPPALRVLALHGPLKELYIDEDHTGFGGDHIALFVTACQDKCARGLISVRVPPAACARCVWSEWCVCVCVCVTVCVTVRVCVCV